MNYLNISSNYWKFFLNIRKTKPIYFLSQKQYKKIRIGLSNSTNFANNNTPAPC